MGKKGTAVPDLSYFDAMSTKINNELICQMQTPTFQAWVDECIARVLMPEEVKRQLVGYNFDEFVDRWSCMCILLKHGISLQAD